SNSQHQPIQLSSLCEDNDSFHFTLNEMDDLIALDAELQQQITTDENFDDQYINQQDNGEQQRLTIINGEQVLLTESENGTSYYIPAPSSPSSVLYDPHAIASDPIPTTTTTAPQ